jgi:predicted phosphodiesterase
MSSINRRSFLSTIAQGTAVAATSTWAAKTLPAVDTPKGNDSDSRVAFFVIGDTHFLANKESPAEMNEVSQATNSQLVATLNRLQGTEIAAAAGGGAVQKVAGLIHAGDIIDTGDKTGGVTAKMQQTEWDGYQKVFGLTGKEGALKMPVFEVHGNHDSPSGVGVAIDGLKERTAKRSGLKNKSANGMHYSWDWGHVHFVNLGITVGAGEKATKRRRYAPLESLDFLVGDLEQHVGSSGKLVVLTHHIDIARYSGACDAKEETPVAKEWDSCDMQAYYAAISKYRIAGIFYGHTHARNIYRWNGTPEKTMTGLPVFNVDNSAHFNNDAQAFFYVEISEKETLVRELGTKNRWRESEWSPQQWRMELG